MKQASIMEVLFVFCFNPNNRLKHNPDRDLLVCAFDHC